MRRTKYLIRELTEEKEFYPSLLTESQLSSSKSPSRIISSNAKLSPKFLRIERILGEGSFGAVYKGTYNTAHIAAKKLKLETGLNMGFSKDELLEDFEAEAFRFSRLSHPNIVEFYGACEQEGAHYMVMEFCHGGDLLTATRANKLSWADKWRFALEIAHGLNYLHSQGARHSDLKLNNILLDSLNISNAKAKVADFGLTRLDALLGEKDSHMNEKVFKSMGGDKHADDVYRFGARILCELAVEELPDDLHQDETIMRENSLSIIDGNYPIDESLDSIKTVHEIVIPKSCPLKFVDLIRACCAEDAIARPKFSEIIVILENMVGDFIADTSSVVKCLFPKIDSIIHPARDALSSYIPHYVSRIMPKEGWDSFLENLEKKNKTSLLSIKQIITFLRTPKAKVFLLFGEGFGKTLFGYYLADCLLRNTFLLNKVFLPILLRPGIYEWTHGGVTDGINKALKASPYNLTNKSIAILQSHPILFILDGYNELTTDIAPQNLPSQLGLDFWPQAKLMVTSRQIVSLDNRLEIAKRFDFEGRHTTSFLLPFNIHQINEYLSKQLDWQDGEKARHLQQLRNMGKYRNTLRNPFVLSLYSRDYERLSIVNPNILTKYIIYQETIKKWLAENQHLLAKPVLTELQGRFPSLHDSFNAFAGNVAKVFLDQKILTSSKEQLKEMPFGVSWLKLPADVNEIANIIYSQHRAQSQSHALMSMADFQQYNNIKLSRFLSFCPLRQRVNEYDFTNKSFFEYFSFQHILTNILSGNVNDLIQALSTIPLRDESEILMFAHEFFKNARPNIRTIIVDQLFSVITSSRNNANNGPASSNAITLLNWMGVSLQNRDFSNIHLPNADLGLSILTNSCFNYANLQGVRFNGSFLSYAKFFGANMESVTFDHDLSLAAQENTINQSTQKRIGRPLCGHTDEVRSIAFSHDSKLLASGGDDKTIILWDVERQLMHGQPLTGHTDEVRSIAFSHDSKLLASGGDDKTIILWDVERQLMHGQPLAGHTDYVTGVAFSHDSKLLASGSYDSSVILWDVERQLMHGQPLAGHTDYVSSIAFSHDSKLLASGSYDSSVILWDLVNRNTVTIPCSSFIRKVIFNKSNNNLIIIDAYMCYIYAIETREKLTAQLAQVLIMNPVKYILQAFHVKLTKAKGLTLSQLKLLGRKGADQGDISELMKKLELQEQERANAVSLKEKQTMMPLMGKKQNFAEEKYQEIAIPEKRRKEKCFIL